MKKKIVYMSLLGLLLFSMANPVFALDITACNKVLKGVSIDESIPQLIHTIIVIIKVAVPVILVIFGSIDLLKGLTAQKEDEIKKGQQIFIKRLIAGALVFFIASIVQLIISLVSNGSETGMTDCVNCFINNENCGKKDK